MARSQRSIKREHQQHPRNSLTGSKGSSNQLRHSNHEANSRYRLAVAQREMQQREYQQVTDRQQEQQEQQVFSVDVGIEPSSRTSSGSSSGYNGRGETASSHFYPGHHLNHKQYECSSGRSRQVRGQISDHYDDIEDANLSLQGETGHGGEVALNGEPSISLLIDDEDEDDGGTFQQHPASILQYSSHQPQYHSLQCADSELLHHSSLAINHQHQHKHQHHNQFQSIGKQHCHDGLLSLGRQGSCYSTGGRSIRERLANELIDTSQHRPSAHTGASIKKARSSSSTKHHKSRHTSRSTTREPQVANSNQQLFCPPPTQHHLHKHQQHQFASGPPEASLSYHLLPPEANQQSYFRYLHSTQEASYLYQDPNTVRPTIHKREQLTFHEQPTKKMHPPQREATSSQQTPAAALHHQRRNHHSSNRKHRPSSRSSTTSTSKTPLSCCAKLNKLFLFVANILFWTTGVALCSWGILNLVDDHKYNLSQLLVFEPSGRMSLFQLLSWSFITLGCATVLVGFCGCSAIFKNNRWILGLYIFLILAIFALDLATGLLAIIFQERLVATVRLKLANKLRSDYGVHASFTAALDYIQTRYECCGSEGHFDYEQSLWRMQRLGGFEATVARTCCHLRNTYDDQAHVNPRPVNESMCQSTDVRFHQSYRYRKGCIEDLERLIRQKIWNFIMGCGGAGAVILISLLFATCFCRLIPKSKPRHSSEEENPTDTRNHQKNQH